MNVSLVQRESMRDPKKIRDPLREDPAAYVASILHLSCIERPCARYHVLIDPALCGTTIYFVAYLFFAALRQDQSAKPITKLLASMCIYTYIG